MPDPDLYTEDERRAIAAELDAAGIPRSADGSFTLPEREDPPPRWGVFTRDLSEGEEWAERHRWAGNDLVELPDREAAGERAAEVRNLHPEWEVETRLTSDPLPGTFRKAFAEFLPGRNNAGQETSQ
jgi:hypothetical protein